MRQAIETKFIGPTNHRGARIKASAQGGSVTVSYDHALNADQNHDLAARTLAVKLGWGGHLIGGGNAKGNGNVYVFAEDGHWLETDGSRKPLPKPVEARS